MLADMCIVWQINTGGIGFYRTQYAADMFDALMPAITSKALPPRDRLGMQNDVFALVGYSSTSDINLMAFCSNYMWLPCITINISLLLIFN